MLNTVMVVLTWAIGVFGVGGAAVATVAVVALGPAAVLAALQPILSRFFACSRCIAAVVFVLAAVGAYWVGREGEYERGHRAALAEIAAEDEGAIGEATALRETWKACRGRGGQWDQTAGHCS